ncbi:hypothetical protein EYF80_064540 [Liparis tanakae]|uniref:Uncharacterized protein n=1 Tax=Liparis tanakae TaxID=230148 RepID=A0A4Z2EAQ4_9TELE|nr:hypothetical protein EYF80_064540 [Liparis tanakae]
MRRPGEEEEEEEEEERRTATREARSDRTALWLVGGARTTPVLPLPAARCAAERRVDRSETSRQNEDDY